MSDIELSSEADLAGLTILVVEDDTMIGFFVEDMLSDFGCSVWLASGVAEAMALLDRQSPNGAVLDINLGAEMVFPVAEALRARGTPFTFLTGYTAPPRASEFDTPVLTKPVDVDELGRVLGRFRPAA